MPDPGSKETRHHRDLLVGIACVVLFAGLGLAALTRAAPPAWRLDAACSGRILARHAIVGGLMLLGPIGAELLLTDGSAARAIQGTSEKTGTSMSVSFEPVMNV